MKKGLLVGLAIALMASTNAFAGHGHGHGPKHSGDGFSAGTLNGTYLFEASGFGNDGSPGEVGVLGTLTFDGTSAVTGNLTMTAADGGQFSCTQTIAGGTYSVTGTTPPGTGTMTLPMSGGGSVNFALVIPNPSGKWADALESDSTGGITGLPVTCGSATINTMVLKGHMRLVPQDNGDHED